MLLEDGSRQPYTYPQGGRGRGDGRYFKLPHAYWTDEHAWYSNLSFPAKAMLLIALSLTPPFLLPTEKAPRWYGISTDSAERGLRELGKVDLLQRRAERKTDWLTAAEYVVQYRYQLRSPFGAPRRQRGHIHIHVAGEAAS